MNDTALNRHLDERHGREAEERAALADATIEQNAKDTLASTDRKLAMVIDGWVCDHDQFNNVITDIDTATREGWPVAQLAACRKLMQIFNHAAFQQATDQYDFPSKRS